jgi:hypothetical protein
MGVKTRVRVVATMVVAALTFWAYSAYTGQPGRDQRPKHELILSLVYIPMAPVRGKVGVKVTESGKIRINEPHVGTPWAINIMVSEGSVVLFTSTKSQGDLMTMSCTIHDTNGHLHDQQDLPAGRNSVTCKASIL